MAEQLKQEQFDAIQHNQGNLLLSASAGSGKTFVMIKRIIRLVAKNGVSVKDIMAVTYTEASANDIKEKLRKALVEEYNQTGNKYLIEQLNDLPTADISTMHSFCRRLIKKYFFVAEVSPDFRLIDESESASMKNTALNQLFKECYENPTEQFRYLCNRHFSKRNDGALKEIILKIFRFVETEARPKEYLYNSLKLYTPEGLKMIVDDFIKRSCQEIVQKWNKFNTREIKVDGEKFPKTFQSINNLYNYYSDIVKACECGQILSFNCKTSNFNTDKELPLFEQNEVKYYREVKQYLSKTLKDINNKLEECKVETYFLDDYKKHATALADMVARFIDIYQDMKSEEGVVDFADLEHLALKVLCNSEAQEEIKKQYNYIFVDECQDINGVQDEIIEKLSSNNLFMVGDVKQSIYGFRGCKPQLFQNKFNDIERLGGYALRLNYNFRCAQNIIDLVNRVFNYSMRKDTFGEDYKNSQLVAGGVYDELHTGRVKLHHLVKEENEQQKQSPSVYDIQREVLEGQQDECNNISSLLARIINQEVGSKYYDFKSKTEKVIDFGDIAILTKNRDNDFVKEIVRGLLQRGFPVTSLVGNNVCDYPEIQVLSCLLALVQCCQNDVPLSVVMKSPIGKFTDDELMDIVRLATENQGYVTNFYKAYNCVKDGNYGYLTQKVKAFDEYIQRIRFLSDFKSARQVLKIVINDCNLEAHLLASKDGEKKIKRLNAYLSATATADKEFTVVEFLNKLNDKTFQVKLTESAGEQNCIQVMTIHHSKGLEYPVVIVCGMERGLIGFRESSQIRTEREVGFVVKKYDEVKKTYKESLFSQYVDDKVNKNKIAEQLRLLYVALTRAKYSLHVTLEAPEEYTHHDLSNLKSFLDFFPEDLTFDKVYPTELSLEKVKETRKVAFGERNQTTEQIMEKRFAFSYPFEEDTTLPLKTSVTSSLSQTQQVFDLEEVYEEKSSFTLKTDTNARKGTTAHTILENFDFTSTLSLIEQVDLLKERGILCEDHLDGVNLQCLERAVNTLRGIIGDGKIYREQVFLVEIPAHKVLEKNTQTNIVMQGIVDLLVEDKDGFRVVDYKYSNKNADGLIKTYKKQLELYAYSVEKILGRPIKSKTIVNLVSGEVINI